MNVIHLALGVAVVVLSAVGGVLALRAGGSGEVPPIVGWATAALALQLVTGFFLITGTVGGPGAVHTWLPVAALAALVGARTVSPPTRNRVVGAAALLTTAVGVAAMVTGLAAA